MGIVYYKGGYKFECSGVFSRPSIIFARCHSVIKVAIPKIPVPTQLDAVTVMVIPTDAPIKLKSVTAMSHMAILCPSPPLLKKTAKTYGIPARSLLEIFSKTKIIKRTNWLNEIMHRLIFERIEAGNNQNETTTFLETEIVKEIYYVSKTFEPSKNVFNLDESDLYNNTPVLKRALNYIETRLFTDITMNDLAKYSFAGEATLLRVFNKEFSKTPFDWIAGRRLDESLILLRNKKYSVGEVSDIIGYKTVSGFISAFKERFKRTPLSYRKKTNS
ncbi:MAG: hypothetical protein A2X28_10260 [Elusimicrobia bacterium GWA2_56_46]|nr:MAG: hypothetical protein A2X28_10260 [Elusimicrobia bacterium GWA2_56_46]